MSTGASVVELPPVDLAVVGGGPVGVATALLAQAHGLSAAVFEREPEVYALPRAVGMDDEFQRVLHGLGLGAELAEMTTPLPGAEFVDATGHRLSGFEFPLDAPWPLGLHPMVMYHQPELEQLLRSTAIDRGVLLHLRHTVAEVDQNRTEAWVDGIRVSSVDQTEEMFHQPARWVVAADGAGSPTRRSLGIAFEDAGFDQDWLVVDAQLHDPRADHGLPAFAQQICDPARPTTFVPGHGPLKRWEFQLQPGEERDAMIDPARVWRLLEPWLSASQADLGRAVVYRFHATVAARMRSGRIFLAGDAAHQMPPFMGQGLCSGIRDGANLAWKLAAVARGIADEGLLDSYDLERRPHALETVDYAVDVGQTIDRLAGRVDPDEEVSLDAAYSGGRPFPHLTDGLVAGDHPLVGNQSPRPSFDGRPIDTALGLGFGVLVRNLHPLAPPLAARWESIGAHIVAVGETPGFDFVPPEGALIIRPDRYVAGVAESADEFGALSDALLAWFDAPRAA